MSISKRIGIIISAGLFVTLTIMLMVLLINEKSNKIEQIGETAEEVSDLITKSITFAMGEGVEDVAPYIEKAATVDNVVDLRIIPTNKVREGSESEMDQPELSVINNKIPVKKEETFKNISVFRSIVSINANEGCTGCHDVKEGDPMAVVSVRYSMESTYKAIADQQMLAILLGLLTIVAAVITVVVLLKKRILNDLFKLGARIKILGRGEFSEIEPCNRKDEIGELSDSLTQLQGNLKQKAEAAVELSKGNLDIKIISLSDNDVLSVSMQKVKDNLSKLTTDLGHLTSAAIEGDFKFRIDESAHSGEFRKIIEEINAAIHSILQPIKDSSNILAEMANGNLSVRMGGNYKGEHKILKENINSVVSSLDKAIIEVNNAVEMTISTANQILSSTQQMTQGVQNQSMQASEVASSIEEMTSTIFETSSNTTKAAKSSKTAGNRAQNGVEKINDAIMGMKSIVSAAGKTGEKISNLAEKTDSIGSVANVINEIADQTNLLALNAAIEAARAGEQGRGFAVVADEVRKLAERTSKATSEISETIKLIQVEAKDANSAMLEAGDSVNKGMILTNEVAEVLKLILEDSENVNLQIEQVAAASEEQSSAAEQISRSIITINSVSQESATAVDHIAGTVSEMHNTTLNLKELVRGFKVSR